MPKAFPSENLYNLVSRFAKLNGLVNHLQATQYFLHSQDISVADTKLVPRDESLYTKYYVSNTVNPLITVEKLRVQLGQGSYKDSSLVPARKSTLQNESFGDFAFWRYCPICYEHDVAVYGVGYWHLTHQLPTTLICTEHRCNLHEIALKKKYLHDKLWLINDSLQFRKEFYSPLDKHWMHIAQIGKMALEDYGNPYSLEVIKQTFMTELKRRGLIDTKGSLKINVFEASFHAYFGDNFIFTLKQRLLIKKPRYLATELLHGFKGRVLNRLILVHWLFGTWAYFRTCCDWCTVFNEGDVGKGNTNERTIKQTNGLKTKSRELCESYLLSTDKPNRIEFCSQFYSDFRWLLNYDKEWFDRVLPVHGFSRQTKLKF